MVAERDGDLLRLTIRDDGPGPQRLSPRWGGGVGLANTRARLEELYGGRYTFALAECPQGGTAVTITLPFVPLDGIAPGMPAAGMPSEHMVAAGAATGEGRGYAA